MFVSVSENGKLVARKKQIIVGEVNNNQIEVKSGLQIGDQLITEGFQNVYDGQVLKIDTKK